MAAFSKPAQGIAATPPAAPARFFFSDVGTSLLLYCLTSIIVVLGVAAGHGYMKLGEHAPAERPSLLGAFAVWDGEWYEQIMTEGYSYRPGLPSNIAFFPAYPLLGRWIGRATGAAPALALLLVSHASLAAAFVVFGAYLRKRAVNLLPGAGCYALLAFGLFPTTFFFRMAYTESLFVFCVLAALYAMERRWPFFITAGLVGFATATRPVAVALLLPLSLHLWKNTAPGMTRARHLVAHLALGVWGLAAFMLYQYAEFGEPLAFAKTQADWHQRPPEPLGARLVALAQLEPLWSGFDPLSPCYWKRHDPDSSPLFSLNFLNPFFFVLAVLLTALGAWRRWLSRYEIALALGLLLIPYLTRSHEMCMAGMGRFAAVALPVYLVLGQFFARLPVTLAMGLLGVSAFLLGLYSALFASWHSLF
jgi:hypothetical protein